MSLLLGTILDGSARPEPLPVECRHLTLIIPGFLGTRNVMRPLEAHLRSRNFTTRTVNLGLRSAGSFAAARACVEYRLDRLRVRSPFIERIDLIGHSMGGLIALDILQSGKLHDFEVRLVTLGAPFAGTSIAHLARPFSGSATELTPERRRRSSDPQIDSTRFLSLAGSNDALAPAPACRHGCAINETLPVDHAGLVLDERVHRLVTDFLKP
ncbi:MAG: alpha/beta fold hydrolase [Candidatus Uhrbacteria bacterium]|nr:alpha/beta fold hydrolase [Candidatus Uhrbacteria bacterium]